MTVSLQVATLKPSKFLADGYEERFRRGFMPNSTVPYKRSMVPAELDGMSNQVHGPAQLAAARPLQNSLFKQHFICGSKPASVDSRPSAPQVLNERRVWE